MLWQQRSRPLSSRVVMQAAIALTAIGLWLPDFVAGLGAHPSVTFFATTLRIVALLGTVAVILTRRIGIIAAAVLGEVTLYFLTGYLLESNRELLALHIAWLGLLVGLFRADNASAASVRAMPTLVTSPRAEWLSFALATALAAIVGTVVLQRTIGSSDEWAYTYQAAVFAKFHAYANEPPCSPAFQNFWVFAHLGRQFSQYTPGWPYFMVPFVWIGAPWLAGSFAFGLLVVGLVRLTRRAMASADDVAVRAQVNAAGHLAAFVAILSSTLLINGGSRFSHIFVLTTYVWALEALLRIAAPTPRPTAAEARTWGAVLGACAALLLATRPVDGAGLGIGLFVYFVYAFVRKRVALDTVVAIAVAFALLGGLTLVILRLQLGTWFTTGYSLTSVVHPWQKIEFAAPKANEWRWGFPLATGSYGWWPCSLAVGFGGLASLGRGGRPLSTILFLSLVPVLVFYSYLDMGRGFDWGYGPRYQMVLMIPMVIGSGVALARLWCDRNRAFFGAALAMIVVSTLRLAQLVYPYEYGMVANQSRFNRTIDEAHLHNAIVLATVGAGGVDPLDLTQNLPLDMYPNQDVIIAIARTPSLERCVRDTYPNRALYRASGGTQIALRRER
jgi:hypothetical protein